MHILPSLILLLATSVLAVLILRRIGLPPILGYVVVGTLLGPHAGGFVAGGDVARDLAEFGVVFLMFSIGLEFSLPKLYSMRRIVFGLGAAQVALTMVVLAVVSGLFGMSWQGALAVGAVLALSSTAILSKMLVEKMALDTPYGKEVIGVLLFQDIAVVPLIIIIPAFSQPPEQLAMALGIAALKAVAVLGLVLFLGQRMMRAWFYAVARGRSSELFMLNVLLITLGLAYVTELAGLSLALGAFMAGMLISETEYRYQVEEDIKPFRDVLMGFFFVTVGMLLNPQAITDQWMWILLSLVLLLGIKFAIIAGLSRLFGAAPGTALRVGLWLCAGGEFGFVLLALVGEAQLASEPVLQVLLATLLLSLLVAPLLAHFSDRIVLRLVPSEWLMRSMQLTQIAAQSMFVDRHALICGYGRNGQYLSRFFEQEGVSFIALDLDPERVRDAAAAGETVVFGDAGRHETLIAAGIKRASVVVITYADTHSAMRVLHQVREIRPELPVVVRTSDERDIDVLSAAGAAEVVPESLESSIMLASHALVLVGIPLKRVLSRIREIRGQRYRLLRGIYRGAEHLAEEAVDERHQERLHSVSLTDEAFGIGRSIEELGLPEMGVQVTAVRRRGIRSMEPIPETRFEAGDVVVMLGDPERLAAAETRLLKG